MKLYTSKAMKTADSETINRGLVLSLTLMERAAAYLAQAAFSYCGENPSAAVFCGCGNNGGDGFAAAYMLLEKGVSLRLFLIGNREKLTPDAAEMERRFLRAGGKTEVYTPEACDYVNSCDVIIDAIFGFGLNSPVRGLAADAIACMNASTAPVVAADIASGVEADTGKILGCAVNARETVTFTGAKPGHFILPGGLCTGRLQVCPIGVPEALLSGLDSNVSALTEKDVSLPRRPRDAHKGHFGKVLIIGGSADYTGAPILASEACVRSGAGLVSLGIPEVIYPITAVRTREVMPVSLPCNAGRVSAKAAEAVLERLRDTDVCLIGPGLGRGQDVTDFVLSILREAKCQIILDADGINAISGHISILRDTVRPCVLTPHDGEFARLGGSTADGRLAAAHGFAQQNRCILVLKGYRTLISSHDGRNWVNTTGNPGMATGGSGDVLGGIIAGLCPQLPDTAEAAAFGVYLHGLAGDLAAEKFGEYSMTPTDLIGMLPDAFKSVTR